MNLAPIKLFLLQNSPSILTGFGIAGVAATAIATGKASIKADRILEEMHYTSEIEPTKKDKIKAVWPVFIPPVAFGILTAGCIIASHSISLNRQLALLSAYSMSEKALANTEAKLSEKLGEKKFKKLQDDIAADDVKKNPPVMDEVIKTGMGDLIFRDGVVGGQDFTMDIENLKSIFNKLNNRLNNQEFVTVNEMKWEMGLPQATFWDDIGWGPGEQIEPYWSVTELNPDHGDEHDLQFSTAEDLKTVYTLKYNKPALIPNNIW